MQLLTLNQAAKACNKSKSAILEAIRNGRLSANRNDKNQWQIQPAELFRVYPSTEHLPPVQNRDQPGNLPHTEHHPTPLLLEQMLEKEQQERERERQQMQATIDDLRRRLDEEAAERRKLTALITHQPEQKLEPDPEQPISRLWQKLFGRITTR